MYSFDIFYKTTINELIAFNVSIRSQELPIGDEVPKKLPTVRRGAEPFNEITDGHKIW